MGLWHIPVLQRNVISVELPSWIKSSTAQPGQQEPCKSYLRNSLTQALSVNQGIPFGQCMEVGVTPNFFIKFGNDFSAPFLGAEHHVCGWELLEGILNMWPSNFHIG